MQQANTPIIVKRFLNWKDTADVSKRAAAASALARAYLVSDMAFEERCAAEAALTELTDDPSPRVRMALAEALAVSPRAPDQILVSLLHDRFDIASLIIARSPRVREMDLVDRVRCGDPKLQMIIAQRGEIGRMLALALCRHAGAGAVIELLGNRNAKTCRECHRLLVERFADDGPVRAQLLKIETLDQALRYRLLLASSEQLSSNAMVSGLLGASQARDTAEAGIQRAVLHLVAQAEGQDCSALIDVLRADGRLTTALLIRAGCHGHMDFLSEIVADLAGMPRDAVIDAFAAARAGQIRTILTRADFTDVVAGVLNQAIMQWRAVSQGRLLAGVQEITHGIMESCASQSQSGHDPANDDIEGLLRSIYLDAVRENARSHARAVAQLEAA